MSEFSPTSIPDFVRSGQKLPRSSKLFRAPAGWLSVFAAINRVGAARVAEWDDTEEEAGSFPPLEPAPPIPPPPHVNALLAELKPAQWHYAGRTFETESEAGTAFRTDLEAFRSKLRAQARLSTARDILSALLQKKEADAAEWLPKTGDIRPIPAKFWRSVAGEEPLRTGLVDVQLRLDTEKAIVVIHEAMLASALVRPGSANLAKHAVPKESRESWRPCAQKIVGRCRAPSARPSRA